MFTHDNLFNSNQIRVLPLLWDTHKGTLEIKNPLTIFTTEGLTVSPGSVTFENN